MSKTGFDLITMGRSSIDLYSNDVGVPFEEIQSFAAYVGGSPTNIAVGCRRLGLNVAVLTAVGQDKVGDFIVHFLKREGVDTRFIPTKPGARSSAVVLGIEENSFPLVFYRDNAADIQLTIDDVLATPIQSARALEISGTGLSREPSRSATLFAAEEAKRSGATVFMDLDFRADQWHDPRAFGVNVRAILPLVDVALGTEEEINAAMITDPEQITIRDQQISAPEIHGDLEANIERILSVEQGPEALVVKRGADGATVHLRSGEVISAPG
ncbi:MAG: 5-dehydro-2-deoxygluconokinase, partial [Gemmatimonadota bacterium]